MDLTSVDLFSGCGGLSFGAHMAASSLGANLSTAAAVDNWQEACDSYAANLGLVPQCAPVTDRRIRAIAGEVGPVDLLLGGPPCQGFSSVGNRAFDDPRNKLVKAYMRAVKHLQPTAFVMENVNGFVTMQQGKIFSEVVRYAKGLGYEVHAGVLLASAYGVPQNRRRCFIVGVPAGSGFAFPMGYARMVAPNHPGLDVDIRPEHVPTGRRVTFGDATSDLPPVAMGQSASAYLSAPKNAYQRSMRKGVRSLTYHTAGSHGPRLAALLPYIPEGASAHDPEVSAKIPADLRPTSGFANTYARIRWNEPSPTITRNFATPSASNCIHPSQDRALTLREAARCQSFPDSFTFSGTLAQQRLQVGNAVPPRMAAALVKAVMQTVSAGRKSGWEH